MIFLNISVNRQLLESVAAVKKLVIVGTKRGEGENGLRFVE